MATKHFYFALLVMADGNRKAEKGTGILARKPQVKFIILYQIYIKSHMKWNEEILMFTSFFQFFHITSLLIEK
jgi:hypothetical protein